MFYSLNICKYYKYKIQNYINKKHEWRLCMGSIESMVTLRPAWFGSGSGSSPVRAHYDSSALGLAPAPFLNVLGSRSVRLRDVLSGTDHGSGSDPGSSSMGLIGSRFVQLGLGPSGSSPA